MEGFTKSLPILAFNAFLKQLFFSMSEIATISILAQIQLPVFAQLSLEFILSIHLLLLLLLLFRLNSI
jgi:membrane protein implicated in regulation of membrane protease activity